MANTLPATRSHRAPRTARRPRPIMSAQQMQAYLLARETLRRLKPVRSPCVPPDPKLLGRQDPPDGRAHASAG